MATVNVADGIFSIDTQGDWEGCTADPAEAMDTDSSPGSAQLAAGYNFVEITSPPALFDPWTFWLFLSLAGTRAPKTVYLIRWKSATDIAGLASSDWTPWFDGIQPDGSLGLNLASWVANNPAWAVGGAFQWALRIMR